MLAFYTVRTTVNIVDNQAHFDALVWAIGCLCQPEISGNPFEEEEGVYAYRFAIRPHGLDRAGEFDFVASVGAPFNSENTQLVLAARL